jgi:hypothetical protein
MERSRWEGQNFQPTLKEVLRLEEEEVWTESVWFSNEDNHHTTLNSPFLTTVLLSVNLALKLVCVLSSSFGTTTLAGFRPDQLSLSILSRKVFTECRCQRHVKPPTWRTRDLERSNLRHKRPPASEATLANPAAEGPEILPKVVTSTSLLGFLHAVKHDMGQTALLPLRRKACWGFFFRPKNPTASAGFDPANLGTKGQHVTSRPPKPLVCVL